MKTIIKIIIIGLLTSCSVQDNELECECYENTYGVKRGKDILLESKPVEGCLSDSNFGFIVDNSGLYEYMFKIIECE
ncbi:MAG: hypothetical protein HRU18_11180 [Pseudoalteromonas sp.]|uniref:hypothetical protein n=1 Tax=Pseudoalteromonas sp. TaxID=53249 RepID=UPI001D35DFD8|nr:hypothetical protein [Pseudoalteromonas sp.]NRA78762.1 hypothetical protein [Pseudoalteromonas sp.]